jgi:hypothetical protein
MEKKEVYKVVKKNMEGDMVSCYAPVNFEITYELGERAVPKVGKIFCFKTYKDAVNWRVIDGNDMALLLCEAEGVTEMEFHIPNGGRDKKFIKMYRSFWRSPKRWATFLSTAGRHYSIPTGTVFCKAITPIKVINMKRGY